jgi:hypothetical protein
MLFKLLCLYRKGIPLSLSELAKAKNYTGNLILQHAPATDVYSGAQRQARLLDTGGAGKQTDLLPPLLDPVLIKMTEKQMTLQGYEPMLEKGVLVHYAQHWELRLVD